MIVRNSSSLRQSLQKWPSKSSLASFARTSSFPRSRATVYSRMLLESHNVVGMLYHSASMVLHESSIQQDLSDVRSAHKFDEEALKRYLTENVPGLNFESMEIKQFTLGQSNPTYLLTLADGIRLVLRKQPPGKILRGAHQVGREYQIMSALHDEIPVPKARVYCKDTSVIGTEFFVYDFAEGKTFRDPTLTHDFGAPADRRRAYENMAETLASLHSVDFDKVGLRSLGSKPEEFIPHQIEVWTGQYNKSQTHTIEEMDKLIKWLPENIPETNSRITSIYHGDFRIDNLLFNGTEVSAVLDWELCTLGNPLADLAHNCMPYYLPEIPKSPVTGFGKLDLNEHGIPSIEEYLEKYLSSIEKLNKTNISRGDSGYPLHWDFFVVFAFFRAASILQGVYKRALQGNASAENAEGMGKLASLTAKIAWKHAQKQEESTKNGSSHEGVKISTKFVHKDWPSLSFSEPSPNARNKYAKLKAFMHEEVFPNEQCILSWMNNDSAKELWESSGGSASDEYNLLQELKRKAQNEGLWNLFVPPGVLPPEQGGAGLSNEEYAPAAELMGRCVFASDIFNCNAPDTGNMEILALFGNDEQKKQWLHPLLDGSIRSCFAMTEPGVASSDATNMQSTIDYEDGFAVINGRKWWTSGAMHPDCKVILFLGRSNKAIEAGEPIHKQFTIAVVPMDTAGVEVIRPLHVFGYADAPHGHAEVSFQDVKIPENSVLLGDGRGFEIAQKRLGPGRVHHCMRLIGMSERALDMTCERAKSRSPFGQTLAQNEVVLQQIGQSRAAVEQARLATMAAAHTMDIYGNKSARQHVSLIKAVVPTMACNVIDRAIQIHGGLGVSQDTVLSQFWTWARCLRLADGPDEVHLSSLGKHEIKRHT